MNPTPSLEPAPPRSDHTTVVYYDGACPLCSREIATYRRAQGGDRLGWVNAHSCPVSELGPELTRDEALRRLHVRLPDGRLLSGAAAFIAIWQRLPGFGALARLASVPGVPWCLEQLYRTFLTARPLWRARTTSSGAAWPWDSWPLALRRELRTDHAGEAGAVMIYRGVLAMTRDPALRDFARHHLDTEARHLALVETIVPPSGRSRLLPVWKLAGWLTGALPACAGPAAVYLTIEAVETFVDRHYADQLDLIDSLPGVSTESVHDSLKRLRALLVECQADERLHRDDARSRRTPNARPRITKWLATAWAAVVGGGSAQAVRVSRWL